MRRRPHPEPLTQRQLNHELRRLIDLCRFWNGSRLGAGYVVKLEAMVDAHPRGVASSHVQHNLGRSRRDWLEPMRLASVARGAAPLPCADDGSSSAKEDQ